MSASLAIDMNDMDDDDMSVGSSTSNDSQAQLQLILKEIPSKKPLSKQNSYVEPVVLLDSAEEPTRRPVAFPADADASEQDALAVGPLRAALSAALFRWATFPLRCPAPIGGAEGLRITANDLFRLPNFDELREISEDGDGNSKRLSPDQLRQVAKNGELTIPSNHFPGQEHRWRLNALLQKGWGRSRRNLRRALSLALQLLICTARSRFDGKHFSLRQSVRALWKIPMEAVDWLLGRPLNRPLPSEEALRDAQADHLLTGLGADQAPLAAFFNFLAKALQTQGESQPCTFEKEALSTIQILYQFTLTEAAAGVPLDLRLLHRGLWREAEERVAAIVARLQEDSAWLYAKRDALRDALGEGTDALEGEELEAAVTTALDEALQNRVLSAVAGDAELARLGQERRLVDTLVFRLTVSTARLWFLVAATRERLAAARAAAEAAFRGRLEKETPIRAGIQPWLRKQLKRWNADYEEQNRWRPYEEILKAATEVEGLEAFCLLLRRLLEFQREKQPLLEAEMATITEPVRTFRWRQRIWNPANYVVTKTEAGGPPTRVLPVHFSSEPLKRRDSQPLISRDGRIHYSFDKTLTRNTSTRHLGWRWANFGLRYWTWLWNALFYTVLHGPWRSGFGLRALVSPSAFFPRLRLDPATGTLHTHFGRKTPSFLSRLRSLWKHIRNSRASFEAAPDRGLLSKNATRFLNKTWNFVVKGFVGTTILILLIPIACTFFTLGCLLLAITAPAWVLVGVLAKHLFCLLIYDLDGPKPNKNYCYLLKILIFRVLIQGILQPIAALITAIIICPLGSLLVTIGGGLRFGLRSWWDGLMYAVLVKPFARLPSTDSWLARRVAGPGLSSKYFYQIGAEAALLAVQRRVELEELSGYEREVAVAVAEPLSLLRNRSRRLLGPLGVIVDEKSALVVAMKQDETVIQKKSQKVIREQRQRLELSVQSEVRSKIRLSRANLAATLAAAAKLLEAEYPARVIARLSPAQAEEFWTNLTLSDGDWPGLARHLLETVFGPEITHPLEDGESRFRLSLSHVDVGSYLSQLLSGEHREDLDAAAATQAPPPSAAIPLPRFPLHAFDPADGRRGADGGPTYPIFDVNGLHSWVSLPGAGELMLRSYAASSGLGWLGSARAKAALRALLKDLAMRELAEPVQVQAF